jgi:class 3 adenylate cyclase/tetratricopeptide (TPR) repeat protein
MPLETLALSRSAAFAVPSGTSALGERRMITILFADLSGFTALSSRLDPEEVREVANVCFEHLNKTILKEGGTIHKYEGDLVIALFGYPAAHEDDPERAVRAAFRMFRLIPEINGILSARLRTSPDLGLHVGINSGTVVVGQVGAEGKTEVTVMGDAVNLGSRLKDLAERGEIKVSGPVYRATRYLFDYETCEPVAVKGIGIPVKVYRPLREKDVPDPKRGIQGLSSPLVGREPELARLRARVEGLLRGKGGAAFVLGDAGLGKTRLWEELKDAIARERKPVILLEGRCLDYGETVPYWPFLQVLRTIYGIGDQDPHEAVEEKLLARTRAILPETWPDAAPYLGYLLGVRFGNGLDEKVRHLEAKELKSQIALSVRVLLTALFRAQPVLLGIEDFHRMDPASLELLEFLFESPGTFPLLLLALARLEKDKEGYKARERFKAKLGAECTEVLLAPLSGEDSGRFVDHLLSAPGLPEEARGRILARGEGNPFFLEEIVRSLIEAQALTLRSGSWVPAPDLGAFALPQTVQAVIVSRMDKLEPDVREVLQVAAVIGRNFQVQVLGELTGLSELMLTLYLAELEEHEYIREATRDPALEYTFHQSLVQEVAYHSLLKTRRRELHRRAGEVIEALHREHPEDATELLAYQYSRGDDPQKAVLWLSKAGQKAKERYANEEAIACFQEEARILKDGPPGWELELSRTWEALGEIYFLKGDYERSKTCYRDAEQAAVQTPRASTRLRRKLAKVSQSQGRYQEALALYNEVDQTLEGGSAEDQLARTDCMISRSWIYCVLGEFGKAISEGELGLSLLGSVEALRDPTLEAHRIQRYRARGYMTLGTAFSKNGETDRAIELYTKNLELSRKLGDKQGIGQACNHLGNEYHTKGDAERALAMYWESLTLSREIGYKKGIAVASNNMGFVCEGLGQRDKALELYQMYLVSSEEMGYARGIGIGCGNLGGLFLEAGDLDKAGEYLARAEAVCTEIGDRPNLITTCLQLAELKQALARRDGSSDRAAWEAAERALGMAEELDSKELRGRSLLVYGKLHAASGDFPAAGNDLRQAVALFADVGELRLQADAWLEYARMLKAAAAKGVALEGRALDCLEKARKLYEGLNLPHKVKECQ